VRAAFAELLVPLFSSRNRRPGFEQLRLSAAGRYEDYGRLGSSFDPKIGLLWSPIPDLALRASYGTSFRVPLLSEAGGEFYGAYAPAAGLYVDPSQARGLGIYLLGLRPDLRPETSRTWSFGGELTPRFAPGLTLSANYYAIRFSDRIAMSLTAVNVIGNPAFESLVTRNPTLQQVLAIRDQAFTLYDYSGVPGGARPEDVTVILDARTQNTAVTTTRGMDFGARYAFALGQNRFVLDANVNHIISFNDQLTAQSPPFSNFNIPYRPLAWRGRGALSWTRGPFGAALAVNHAGDYRDLRAVIARRVEAFTTFDANLSYRVDEGPFRGMRIALFIENLLDTDPPFLAPDRGVAGGSGYDAVNASARGRFISLQLRKAW
jgi:outer membrane receptor protein involved in Fe transport